MTRQISPDNQKTVPVLDTEGKPLVPTRPSRARRWLETGKAKKVWVQGHFAVQLTENLNDSSTPEMSINIDPGAKVTGIAVVIHNETNKATAVASFELHHRGHIVSQRMQARKAHRRSRRSRLRRRPARFNNRTRKEGWMPPSMQSRLSNVTTTVRHLRGLFPITKVYMETNRFDPRLIQDPGIQAVGYQSSERGRMQVREYVLQRDNRTCQYQQQCKEGEPQRLETDHIVPRSRGGTYRISNLITACHECNQQKSNQNIEQFLYHDRDRLIKVKNQLKKSLASATHMNQLVPLLRQYLEETGLPVAETDAVTTAYTRQRLGIAKTHVNDAISLSGPERVKNLPQRMTILQSVGHGRRQMLTQLSRHGTPRYKPGPQGKNSPYRAYCRIPRDKQGFTTTPGHKLRQRRRQGITSGDLIRYNHHTDGELQGYVTLTNRNSRAGIAGKRSVQTSQITLLARGNGYRRATGENNSQIPAVEPRV